MSVIKERLADLRERLESAAFLVSKGGNDKQVHSDLVQAIITLAEIERSFQATSLDSAEADRYAHERSKVQSRLRLWARPDRQDQINSRILNAYLWLERTLPVVTEADIKRQLPDIESFDGNFAQMKTIAEKNHGKIFEQSGNTVSIWEPVLDLVREYERNADAQLNVESHQILSVEIVDGRTLQNHWRSPMQVVETNRGKFIDVMPGASGGFEWRSVLGQVVDGIKTRNSAGHMWIKKQWSPFAAPKCH